MLQEIQYKILSSSVSPAHYKPEQSQTTLILGIPAVFSSKFVIKGFQVPQSRLISRVSE